MTRRGLFARLFAAVGAAFMPKKAKSWHDAIPTDMIVYLKVNWQNFTCQYASPMTTEEFLAKWRDAVKKMEFQPPLADPHNWSMSGHGEGVRHERTH